MILFILFLIIIVILCSDYKTGNLNYVYQEPSPYGLYTRENCYVACSPDSGNEEACDWCKNETPLLGLTDENIKKSFRQLKQ